MKLGYYRFEPQSPIGSPAVLIHGFAATGLQLWGTTGWIRKLTEQGIPVVVVDLPFHGADWLTANAPSQLRSLRPEAEIALTDSGDLVLSTAAGIAQLMDKLSQPTHLIGFSIGARIAYETASTHPRKVLSLTIGGLPQHNHLEALSPYLARLNSGEHSAADLKTDPTFAGIIADSFVDSKALEKFAAAVKSSTFDPGIKHPACPVQLVNGSTDTIAGSPDWLLEGLRKTGIPVHSLVIEGRNHINMMTSGIFKRAALSWILEHETAPNLR